MLNFIDKYYQIIGIFLILAILSGGAGIIWKNSKFQNLNSKQIQNLKFQIQNEAPTPSLTQESKPSKININTASQEELESLSGIGKTKAKAIIDFREKEGKFKNKKDIMKVKGIGEKTYEKIESLISVD
jgi:comEA protein